MAAELAWRALPERSVISLTLSLSVLRMRGTWSSPRDRAGFLELVRSGVLCALTQSWTKTTLRNRIAKGHDVPCVNRATAVACSSSPDDSVDLILSTAWLVESQGLTKTREMSPVWCYLFPVKQLCLAKWQS